MLHLLLACLGGGDTGSTVTTTTPNACITDHDGAHGGTWTSDVENPFGTEPPVTADEVVAECALNGVTITEDDLVTREAAVCLAEEYGLTLTGDEDGAWNAVLVTKTGCRPEWLVGKVAYGNTSTYGYAGFGEWVVVDALTGAIDVQGSWMP